MATNLPEGQIITQSDSVRLHSGDYVDRYNAKPLDRVLRLAQRMQLTKKTRVADFGCGNGMLLHTMEGRFKSYDGVDFSKDFIDSANAWAERSRCKNYRFHECDINEFCRERPGQFDIAATLDFSEHIEDPVAIQIYSSIRQSLCSNGILYVHTPNLDFLLERAKQLGIIPQFPEHIAVRTGLQMKALLVKAGFDPSRIKVSTIAHYNVLRFLHPLSKLPLIGRFFAARLWIEATAD